MITAALLSVAILGTPVDAEYRAALDLLYDGRGNEAILRAREIEARHPEDPVGSYVEALVLVWMVEQRAEVSNVDRELLQAVERTKTAADGRLRADAGDARARMARAAVSGVKSRFHMWRGQRRDAARTAVAMREDLLALKAAGHEDGDVDFGLGLYDYYADVLPRYARMLRWLAGIPGGQRARGLAAVERASEQSVLHRVEAHAQLYEIYAFYEDDAERALVELEGLQRAHPLWPLWTLKLAEHLRSRMGAYAESASVARALMAREKDPRHPPGNVAVLMARLALGRALLADYRLEEVRRALLPARTALEGHPALATEARFLLGRSLELEGDRDGAAAHYKLAAAGGEGDWKRRAQEALSRPTPPAEVRAHQLLAEARRRREAGQLDEAAGLYVEANALWPSSVEAALGAAEEALAKGEAGRARALIDDASPKDDVEPPWLRSWAWLLRARAHDLGGEREAAVELYKKVLKTSYRRSELREGAAAGLRTGWQPPGDRGRELSSPVPKMAAKPQSRHDPHERPQPKPQPLCSMTVGC